jgi:hypothetical protein
VVPPIADLELFIAEAIENGWPNNTVEWSEDNFPGFYGSRYERSQWRYLDLWAGATTDMGIQFVFHEEQPVWGCSYRGGITDERFLESETIETNPVFSFLIESLRLPSTPGLPIRGPSRHSGSDPALVYQFSHVGSVESFTATEYIDLHGAHVYERVFVGGRFGDGVRYVPFR